MGSCRTVHSVPVYVVLTMLVVAVGDLFITRTMGSEFPERECCDSVYPQQASGSPHSGHGGIAPSYPENVPVTPTVTTEIPVQPKTATEMMNCITARDFCMANLACHPILEIVPRVCGPEKVACSTVTVKKCQAALRTLQAFPYFAPTCLCREPISDPACNTFRDYLFDHPCSFVKEKEKDPYPVDALPTCDYALDVCKKETSCMQLYRDFKSQCKTTDKVCKMDDGELCHNAWIKLRLSPMFGCICPNGNNKCDRIFQEVNYNTCVAVGPTALDFTGTSSALYSLDQHRQLGFSAHFSFSPSSLFPPRPATKHFPYFQYIDKSPALQTHQHAFSPEYSSHYNVIVPAARTDSHLSVDEQSLSTPISYHGYHSPGSFSTSHSGSITVQVISTSNAPDHEIESQLETPLLGPGGGHDHSNKPHPFAPVVSHTPIPKSTTIRNDDLNNNNNRQSHRQPQPPVQPPPQHTRYPTGIATISSISKYPGGSNADRSQVRQVSLKTTCLTVLQSCRRTQACNSLLEQVLHWCDPKRCRQDTCMLALQTFYRQVEKKWAMEVAFCLCSKAKNRLVDQCLIAQEQLHPVCAQRGDLGSHPPSCNSLADECRQLPDCKPRLEYYEQACSVDSDSKRCAGSASECRNAIIGILGTKLRTSCACNGTDFVQLFDCLGWQRILWVNPCVVESQRNYHNFTSATGPRATTTLTSVIGTDVLSTTMGNPNPHKTQGSTGVTSTTTHRTTTSYRRPSSPNISEQNNPDGNDKSHSTPNNGHPDQRNGVGLHTDRTITSEITASSSSTSTSTSRRPTTTEEVTTISTTTARTEPTTTTPPPRYCVIRRPNQNNQHIKEGSQRRLYREDKTSCSEMCNCYVGEQVTCTFLECLEAHSCESRRQVTYLHMQPNYIAHRGSCICYNGHFICEKPQHESFNLPSGVFLFLGFSKKDEEVLMPLTRLTVLDVVSALQELISPHGRFIHSVEDETGLSELLNLNATACRLGLFKKDEENLIINATIEEDYVNFTRQPSEQHFKREKDQCLPALVALKNLVNKQHPVIHNHMLLSILKVANVEENIPNKNSSNRSTSAFFLPLLANLSLIFSLLNTLYVRLHHPLSL